MKRPLRPPSVALAILAAGVAASLLAWYLVGRQVARESAAAFANQAHLATNVVERRVQRYIDLLYGLEALANHQPGLRRQDFHEYVNRLELGRRMPGVQAVEFIRRVFDEDRDAFVARVRADRSLTVRGYPEFDIRPGAREPEYWVVDYLEPFAGNESAFGLDIRSRAGPHEAAARARDLDEPAATPRYRLAQERGGSYGLVLYLPVFGEERPRTTPERREKLAGFVNVVLRVEDMLAGMLADRAVAGMSMRFHDRGTLTNPEPASEHTLFYGSPGDARPDGDLSLLEWRPRHVQEIPVAGRLWQLQFQGAAVTSPWVRPLALLTLVAGILVSLLLYAILRTIARARSEALGLAQKATRELRTQLSFSQQLLEAIPNPVFFKDAAGRYLGCNRAFEDYVGVPRKQLIGKTVFDIAPRDIADRSQVFDSALIGQPGTQVYEASVAFAKSGGERRDVIFNKATFFDPSGAVAGLVGVIVDITQRKRLEAETHESNQRLRAVIQAAPVAIVARDRERRIRMWNPAAERIFGWTEAEALGTTTTTVPEALEGEAERLRLRAEAGETLQVVETRRQHKEGHMVDVSLSISPIYDAAGAVTGTMLTIEDISRRKQAEQALRESESHLRLAMEAAQMGMWYWESGSDRFAYSEGLNTLFGRAPEAPLEHYRVLQEALHPDDREHFEATLRHAVKQGADFQVDYRVVWPDLSVHWIANRGQVHRGPNGRALRVVGVAMDITDRKIAEQRIAHMAHHDALTGLPNRVLLRDRIGQAIAQAHRQQARLAVLFIDLDRFKTINDSLGHQLGDRLLQSVASRILVCVREGDTVSRVGGDEFVIVIPGVAGDADASAVASKILEVLGHPFHLNGHDLHVAASIGISLYPSDGSDAETLMRNADTAMYHAKDSGRGNFQFFTQHMNVAAQERLSLENAMRRGLENGEFEVHFQPLFDLRTRAITGFEALARWNPPGAASVPPSRFIPAAEESGLIVPIGELVMREALRHAKAWQSFGRLTIAVNVSANQLARRSFVDRLRRLVQDVGIDPRLVELEVTEGVIVEGSGEARQAIDEIAAFGVGIAIDDFGTGYSGLAYLKRLPIDTVKIDQSFVRDLTVDADDAAIVTAIVAMARSLGVDVVAEGVETEEQVAELLRLGCHRAQGFLLARPACAADVTRLLRGRGAPAGARKARTASDS